MEVFVDFGLIEVFAASGLAAVGRVVYRRRATRIAWLAVSALAPALLVALSPSEVVRWISVVVLATAVVNVVTIARLLPAPPHRS